MNKIIELEPTGIGLALTSAGSLCCPLWQAVSKTPPP
jgi:hypothetical protein